MQHIEYEHRNALTLLETDPIYRPLWNDVLNVINGISDDDIIERYLYRVNMAQRQGTSIPKSISDDVNHLISERMPAERWAQQVPIFNDCDIFGEPYQPTRTNDTRWTIDFSSYPVERNHQSFGIALEVAFNHGEAIAWNLIKPVLASELNNVQKAIQTSLGMVICATDSMKSHGNYDNACGSYEKFIRYLIPMNTILTTPILLMGIDVGFETQFERCTTPAGANIYRQHLITADGRDIIVCDRLRH